MTTQVVAANLVNRIVYQSDKSSLKRVRAEMQKLRELSEKNSAAQARQQVAAVKAAAAEQVAVAKKAIKIQKDAYEKATKNGSGMIGSAGMFDAKAVERANRQMAQKQVSADLRAQEKAKKVKDKQRQDATNRDIGATMATRKIAFDVNRLQGLDIGQRYQAIQQAKDLADQYRKGALDLKEMNEYMRQLKVTTSATARQARNLNRKQGKPARTGNSNFLATGAVMGSGLGAALGISAAGYLAYSASREAISSSVERQQGRRMMQSQGLDPFEGTAIIRTVQQQTGMNMSAEKISDIAKDTQDKVGQLSQGQWNKNGQFSGGGEMSDWVNMMVKRGGYSREGAVNTLQNVKGPGDLAVVLQNLKKQAHLTDQEFTTLGESVNDFSYVAKAAGENGGNFITTMKTMATTGSQLTTQQQEASTNLDKLGASATNLSNDLKDKFTASFAKSLSDAGVSTNSLDDSFVRLRPVVEDLGKLIGRIVAGGAWLLNKGTQDNVVQPKADPNDGGLFYTTQSGSTAINLDRLAPWNWFSDNASTPQIGPSAVLSDRYGQFYGSNPFSLAMPPINQNLQTTVQVNVDDIALKNAFTTLADTRIDDAFDAQTWDIHQSLLKY